MTLILDTRQLPVPDRGDAVRETIARTMVPVEITFADAPDTAVGDASVFGAITKLGRLTVCSVHSNAVTVERTRRLAGDDLEPSIFLALQMAGSSLIAQGGRVAVLRPGQLAFSDSMAPYTLSDGDGIRQYFFRIPIDALRLPIDAVRAVSATALSPGHPLADLVAPYFHRLGSRPDLFTQPGAGAVGPPSIDLVRALIATHLDASAAARAPLRATLQLRILEYVRRHLGDPNLCAAQIAAAHHISVRHLYQVLADAEISLGDWIRTQRLEACRDELARPTARYLTIGSVAHRWGFRSASSFGRLFRARYGRSPNQWRVAHQPGRG